eukprot:6226114-Prymnesium_polylepis.2
MPSCAKSYNKARWHTIRNLPTSTNVFLLSVADCSHAQVWPPTAFDFVLGDKAFVDVDVQGPARTASYSGAELSGRGHATGSRTISAWALAAPTLWPHPGLSKARGGVQGSTKRGYRPAACPLARRALQQQHQCRPWRCCGPPTERPAKEYPATECRGAAARRKQHWGRGGALRRGESTTSALCEERCESNSADGRWVATARDALQPPRAAIHTQGRLSRAAFVARDKYA